MDSAGERRVECASWSAMAKGANVRSGLGTGFLISAAISYGPIAVPTKRVAGVAALAPGCHGHLSYTVLNGTRRVGTGTVTGEKDCKSAPHHRFSISFCQVQSLSRLRFDRASTDLASISGAGVRTVRQSARGGAGPPMGHRLPRPGPRATLFM